MHLLLLAYETYGVKLLHGAATNSPRFPGTGWLGQSESLKVVQTCCTLTGCDLPSAEERLTDRLLRGTGPSVATDSSAETIQGNPPSPREIGSYWDVWTEGDGELHMLYVCLANHVSIAPLKWGFAKDAARLIAQGDGQEWHVVVSGWGPSAIPYHMQLWGPSRSRPPSGPCRRHSQCHW